MPLRPEFLQAPDVPRPRVDPGLSCAEQARTDELLLRAGAPAVRVAVLTDGAVSLGVGAELSPGYAARARSRGLSVVRRASGGTALLHAAGDLAWTVVLPRRNPLVGRDYVRGYGRLGAGVVRFLEEHQVPSAWTPSPGLSSDYCLLGRRGYVLTVGSRILGGAAQHLTGTALLHHGILPRTLDRSALAEVFDLSEANGLGRLTSLEELGLTEAADVQAGQLARALSEALAPT